MTLEASAAEDPIRVAVITDADAATLEDRTIEVDRLAATVETAVTADTSTAGVPPIVAVAVVTEVRVAASLIDVTRGLLVLAVVTEAAEAAMVIVALSAGGVAVVTQAAAAASLMLLTMSVVAVATAETLAASLIAVTKAAGLAVVSAATLANNGI